MITIITTTTTTTQMIITILIAIIAAVEIEAAAAAADLALSGVRNALLELCYLCVAVILKVPPLSCVRAHVCAYTRVRVCARRASQWTRQQRQRWRPRASTARPQTP